MKEIKNTSELIKTASPYGDETALLARISDRLEEDILRYDKFISAEEEFNEY